MQSKDPYSVASSDAVSGHSPVFVVAGFIPIEPPSDIESPCASHIELWYTSVHSWAVASVSMFSGKADLNNRSRGSWYMGLVILCVIWLITLASTYFFVAKTWWLPTGASAAIDRHSGDRP